MFKHFRHTILMTAVLAASVGGTGFAAPAAAPIDDGKTRVRNTHTDQVNEFDTIEQAENFLAGIDDPESWTIDGHHAKAEASTGSGDSAGLTDQAALAPDSASPAPAAAPSGSKKSKAASTTEPAAPAADTTAAA